MHTAEVVDFQHSAEIWRDFPELVPGTMLADVITHDVYDQGPAHTQNAQFGAALLTMQRIKLPPRTAVT